MDVLSACPLRVGSIQWQPRPGAFMLTVVCKATFVLLPGASVLAGDQDPLNETDDHWNDDEARSLSAASDLVPFKRGADVFLVGHAYAPSNESVASLTARLTVGELDKAIEVHTDRMWTSRGELREAALFMKMPLRYERAGGGPETSNPVGVRTDARPDLHGRVTIPNLQPPGFHLSRPGDAVPPIGFGPIAPGWPERAEKLRRHVGGWDHRRWNEQALPGDIDAGVFNAAPLDQQVGEIRSNARIVLENLHADHPRLVTCLPGLAPRAVIERPGAPAQEVPLRCDTLCIDTDRRVCTLVWRGLVALERADEAGRVTITADGGNKENGSAAASGEAEGPADEDDLETTFATGEPVVEMLPFVGKLILGGRLLSRESAAVVPTTSPREHRWDIEDPGTFDEVPDAPTQAIPALPFTSAPPRSVLPFVPAARAVPAPIERPEASWIPPAMPFTPVSQYLAAPRVEAAMPGLPPTPSVGETLPPAMLGPLAIFATPVAAEGPEEAPEAAPVAPAAPEPVALPLAAFPAARCAAIAAALAHRPPDRARILERHELAPDVWAALDEHWTAELRVEADRGKQALLSLYDTAYVAELERLRGPIRVEEYANLLVAAERGQSDRALAELDLPRGGLLRVKRVWLVKCAEDLALGASLRGAVEDAREA